MANFTRADLKTNNANLLPDNINESITPQDLRDAIDNNADSNVNRITDPYFKFLGTTGGTSTAYTLTNANEYPGDAYTNETYFILQFNANNGASPTLNINGIGAKDLYLDASTQVTFADTITANERYAAVYDSTLDAFLLVGIFNPNAGSVPAGSDGDIQINNAGAFGATTDISIDSNSDTVVSGDLAIGGTTPENNASFNSITLASRNRINSSKTGFFTQYTHNVDADGNIIETTGQEATVVEIGSIFYIYQSETAGTAGSAFGYDAFFQVEASGFDVSKNDGSAGIEYNRITGNFELNNGDLRVDDITDVAGTGAPDFPNGLTLSGGSDVLDDYEEGTHTPTFTPSSSGSITMYGSQTMSYIKIGNLCHFQGEMLASAVSSPTGYINMTLPFTAVNSLFGDEPEESPFQVQLYNINSNNVDQFVGYIPRNSSTARIYLGDGTSYQSDSAQTVKVNTAFVVMGMYRTA